MKILELLRELEWSCRKKEDFGHGDMSWVKACPSCGTTYVELVSRPLGTHEPGCELAKAIRELEGEPGESVGEQGISLETVGSHRTNPFPRPPGIITEHVEVLDLDPDKPGWDQAPDWAVFLAKNADGEWWWYEAEPKYDKHSRQWYTKVGTETISAKDREAQNTLEERP